MPSRYRTVGTVLLLSALAFCSRSAPPPPPVDPAAYARDLDGWKQRRVESLTGPWGWTTLAGLFWLDSARYEVGADSVRGLALPHAEGPLGALTIARGVVRFTARPGAGIVQDSQTVDTITLAADTAKAPTVLTHGSVRFQLIERSGRLAIRVRDSLSARRLQFQGLRYFPVDTQARVAAYLERPLMPRTLRLINIVGLAEEYPSPGTLQFRYQGTSYHLDAAQEPGDSSLFVIFRDSTSHDSSYPAGRFLAVAPPDSSGWTVIDFNRAYNPPCAFTPFATCPLPPRQNNLPTSIRAGELRYEGEATR